MVLNAWWMILVALAVALVAVAIGLTLGIRRNQQHEHAGAPLARAERIRSLPGFAKAVKRRRTGLVALLCLGVATVLVGGVAAARPMASETVRPQQHNRDVMLCLDVSGSMVRVDAEIIDTFLTLLKGFKGERIGLTIFNSSPVQVFPLTDDYDFVQKHLLSLKRSFTDYTSATPEHYAGTLNGDGSSLIGDGLAACAMRFDHTKQQRSRSIIFATDNELLGTPIVTLDEASSVAKKAGVRVFSIDPVASPGKTASDALKQATEATGGKYYALRNSTSVSDIITEVRSQEATALEGQVKIIWHDSPDLILLLFAVLILALISLAWRVRL